VSTSSGEDVARTYEVVAEELDKAAAHCRTAAQNYRHGQVPRGAAHAWSAFGHVTEAVDVLKAEAREHAKRSNP